MSLKRIVKEYKILKTEDTKNLYQYEAEPVDESNMYIWNLYLHNMDTQNATITLRIHFSVRLSHVSTICVCTQTSNLVHFCIQWRCDLYGTSYPRRLVSNNNYTHISNVHSRHVQYWKYTNFQRRTST